jgi:hypothetical protein
VFGKGNLSFAKGVWKMKKFIVIWCVVAGMILFASSAANASSYWMAPEDLDDMAMVTSNPPGGTVNPGGWVPAPPGRVAFKYHGVLPNDPNWGAVQVGYQWTPPGAPGATSMNGHVYPDLSIYDDFRMSIHNQLYDPIKGNIWINTGYTDLGEKAMFAQVHWTNGGWQELFECEWVDLVLDFANADRYENGTYIGIGQIPYLDHVTGIGFAVAYDNPDSYYLPPDHYPYSVDVDTIPEAASIAIWSLLGLSWLGLSVWRRRRMAGGGGSARSSWSEENRVAIHRIIDRG